MTHMPLYNEWCYGVPYMSAIRQYMIIIYINPWIYGIIVIVYMLNLNVMLYAVAIHVNNIEQYVICKDIKVYNIHDIPIVRFVYIHIFK